MVVRLKLPYIFILSIIIFVLYSVFSLGEPLADSFAEGEDSVRLPILMYHEIKTFKLGKDVIAPYEFESDLKFLRDNHYHTVTMAQLIEYVNGKGSCRKSPSCCRSTTDT
jgi:hypothetical protein